MIDSTNLQDEGLYLLLKAVEAQSYRIVKEKCISKQLLLSLSILNTHIGAKSFKMLCQIIPDLTELTIDNIKNPTADVT